MCVSLCVTCGSPSNIAMQTAASLESIGDIQSVGSNKRNKKKGEKPSRTQKRTEADGQEARETLLSTSTYSLLIYSMLAPPSVKVIRVGKPSTWKVTFSGEGHQSGTAPTVSTSGVKGIFYT